ncbi:MAG: polysaccharide deacetylase family protein [Flavipsychrobacter sp.]|nr:polysaccharide deacetylase family protein [Flavipsychrobacter sp.]
MTSYWVKTPWWVKKFFSGEVIWSMPEGDQPTVYLTFDDGPHPTATPFILDQLKQYGAKATFFCIGKNVQEHPELYQRIAAEGHAAGNHTHNHMNGWKTTTRRYIRNILKGALHIQSKAFRPPYGRITLTQVRTLHRNNPDWKIYMWDVLSGDFDTAIDGAKCAENVLNNIEPGSIVVFHDSDKAWERMSYALPLVLEHCKKMNWAMKALPN